MQKDRLCGEDAFYRTMMKVPREQEHTWLAWSERDLYATLPTAFVADWDSTVNTATDGRRMSRVVTTRTRQPSSAFVLDGGQTAGPLQEAAAGRYGPRKPLGRSDGAGVESSRRAAAAAAQPRRYRLCPAKDHGLARNARGGAAPVSAQVEAHRQRASCDHPSAWPESARRPCIGIEQYNETRVKLESWSCERRVIVTRTLKPANPSRRTCSGAPTRTSFALTRPILTCSKPRPRRSC